MPAEGLSPTSSAGTGPRRLDRDGRRGDRDGSTATATATADRDGPTKTGRPRRGDGATAMGRPRRADRDGPTATGRPRNGATTTGRPRQRASRRPCVPAFRPRRTSRANGPRAWAAHALASLARGPLSRELRGGGGRKPARRAGGRFPMIDDRLPFQRLDAYVVAKELARQVHAAKIGDRELREQATDAAKSTFLRLSEGLPHDGAALRRKYFTEANGQSARDPRGDGPRGGDRRGADSGRGSCPGAGRSAQADASSADALTIAWSWGDRDRTSRLGLAPIAFSIALAVVASLVSSSVHPTVPRSQLPAAKGEAALVDQTGCLR